MSILKTLKENILFNGTEDRVLNILASISEIISVPPETVIFAEGMPSDAMFIITSGSVDVIKDMDNGRESTIGVLGKGDVLGALSLINDGKRAVTVRAKEPVELITITKDDFNKLVSNNVYAAYLVVLSITQYFIHFFNNHEWLKEIEE